MSVLNKYLDRCLKVSREVRNEFDRIELRRKWRIAFIQAQGCPELHLLLSKLKSEGFRIPDLVFSNAGWEACLCFEGVIDCGAVSYKDGWAVETETWGHDGYESTTNFETFTFDKDFTAMFNWLRENLTVRD